MSRSDFRFIAWYGLVVVSGILIAGIISGFKAVGIALLAIGAAIVVAIALYWIGYAVNKLIDYIYDRWLY